MNMLPEICFTTHPINRDQIIILYRGESGYREYKCTEGLDEAQEVVNILNEKIGVIPEQVKAMEVGSLFGWDCPGAQMTSYLN